MVERSLLDAFDDCVDRLADGEEMDSCLNRYPDLADRLRPMLETVHLVENTAIEPFEMTQVRERMRLRVETAARTYTRRMPRWPLWRSLALAVINFAVLFLFGLGVKLANDRIMSKDDSGGGISITPRVFATWTFVPTSTIIPPSPSNTAFSTIAASPIPSATPSPTMTLTGTSEVTSTTTNTATQRATFTRTPTIIPTQIATRTPTSNRLLSPTPTRTRQPSATATDHQCRVSPAGNYDVRVRSGGGVEYPAIGELLRGQFYPVAGYNDSNGGWYAVRFVPNTIGWVASSVVRTDGDCDDLLILPYPPLPTATVDTGGSNGNDNSNNNDNQNDNGDDDSNDNGGNGHGNENGDD